MTNSLVSISGSSRARKGSKPKKLLRKPFVPKTKLRADTQNQYLKLKMMRRGMLSRLPSTHLVAVPLINNFMALFHSRQTHLRNRPSSVPKVTNLEDASMLFHEMLRSRPLPSVIPFTQILGQLVKLKHYSAPIPLFKQMLLRGIAPNHCTLSIIINCYCHLSQMGFSLSVLGLCKAGKIESARDLFCGLSSKGVQPDVRTYTIMIGGLCHHGLIIEAEKLLREMGGKGFSPNGCTYNTIIRGLLNNNRTSWAMELIQEMVELGFSADASTMELIVGLLSKDIVDAALLPLLKDS